MDVERAWRLAALEDEILLHAAIEAPNECVGFVIDTDNGLELWPMCNANESSETFFIDPREQYDALNEIEDAGAELVAIYHSHPQGTPTPSERDRAFAAGWPGKAMLIAANGVVRAYTASGEPL